MAKAYEHLEIGSSKQIADFCHTRLHEIRERRSELENEQKMWLSICENPGLRNDAVAHHVAPRMLEIQNEIFRLTVESGAMDLLLLGCQPCPKCGGSGKTQTWIAQDESRTRQCKTCRGTGSMKEEE